MLVVTANWAFTDGTLRAATPGPRVARAWLRGLRRAVIRAGFGRDGTYAPPGVVEIVLAGDTFDCLTSTAWSGTLRPWHGGGRAATTRRDVLADCARRAAPLLAGLAALARRGLDVPTPDRRGRPMLTAPTRVPARVTLLVGDRDRPLEEATADVAARGVAVARSWSDGAVLVQHGHEFDPASHVDDATRSGGRPPTLAESVVVDLVARFIAGLDGADGATPGASRLAAALAAAAIADIPPTWAAWRDVCGATSRAWGDTADTWRRAVDGWVRAARREPPECGMPADPVAPLAAWLAGLDGTPPGPALDGMLDHRVPAAATAGVESCVLGHASAPPDHAATICLGRPPVRPWDAVAVVRADGAAEAACVAAVAACGAPPTIARSRTDSGRVAWRWIVGGDPVAREAARPAPVVVDAA